MRKTLVWQMTGDFYDCFTASEVFRIAERQSRGNGTFKPANPSAKFQKMSKLEMKPSQPFPENLLSNQHFQNKGRPFIILSPGRRARSRLASLTYPLGCRRPTIAFQKYCVFMIQFLRRRNRSFLDE